MLVKIWNYLRGYVIIKVSGFSVERFMNLAMHRSIYIWDVQYVENAVIMKVSIAGYKLLKPCCKKTKCKMKIVKRYGYPFFLFRYRKRKILALGTLFCVLALFVMSQFLWLVEIEGNNLVDYSELKTFVAKNGVKVGGYKGIINKEDLEEDILNNFAHISWVNIYIKGTMARVEIKEILEKKDIIDKSNPCDIVATKDSLITSIVASSGKPVVEVGDVVKKGDILLSGTMDLAEDEFGIIKTYVHSDGEILGKNYYEINFDVPFIYEEKTMTGKSKQGRRISIFNKHILFKEKKVNFDNYNRVSTYTQLNLGEEYPLPIVVINDIYNEYIIEEKERTLEESEELAEKILDNRIMRELAFNVNIVDKTMKISETSEGLVINALVTTIENIGEKQVVKKDVDIEDKNDIINE